MYQLTICCGRIIFLTMDGCRKNIVLAILFASFSYSLGYLPPKETTVVCNSDPDCTSLPFTFCSGNTAYNPGVCSCTADYVLKEENKKFECLEAAKYFNDPCQIDDQCRPKFGEDAACINKKCNCSPTAHFINLKCWKSSKLGEKCGVPSNCIATDFSECNGICKCVPGYIGNPAYTKCLKIAQNLGDPCEDSVQCTSANPVASCQYDVCLCPTGQIPSGNTCTKPATAPPVGRYKKGRGRYSSASDVRASMAMILIALFLFCVKI